MVARRISFPLDEVGNLTIVVVIVENIFHVVVFIVLRGIIGVVVVENVNGANSSRVSRRVEYLETTNMDSFHVVRIGYVGEVKVKLVDRKSTRLNSSH